MAKRDDRATTGVFIAWDEEEVDVERRDAGTRYDYTVATARRTVVKQALWTNEVSDKTIASAEQYILTIKDQYENVRVQVFTKNNQRG